MTTKDLFKQEKEIAANREIIAGHIKTVRDLKNLNPELKKELIKDLLADKGGHQAPKGTSVLSEKEKREGIAKRKTLLRALGTMGLMSLGSATIFSPIVGFWALSQEKHKPHDGKFHDEFRNAPVPTPKADASKDYVANPSEFKDYQKKTLEDPQELKDVLNRLDEVVDKINKFYNKGDDFAQKKIEDFIKQHPKFLTLPVEQQERFVISLFPEYIQTNPGIKFSIRWALGVWAAVTSLWFVLARKTHPEARKNKESFIDFFAE